MNITGTLTELKQYFEEWHENNLHQTIIDKIRTLEQNNVANNNNIEDSLLQLYNLVSHKLDGNTLQIQQLDTDNISTITSKPEAETSDINLKKFNERLSALDSNNGAVTKLQNAVGQNTSNNNNSIFSRLLTLEQKKIPTKTSELTNDSNFLDSTISTINVASGKWAIEGTGNAEERCACTISKIGNIAIAHFALYSVGPQNASDGSNIWYDYILLNGIPEGYRPSTDIYGENFLHTFANFTGDGMGTIKIRPNGTMQARTHLSGVKIAAIFTVVYIV